MVVVIGITPEALEQLFRRAHRDRATLWEKVLQGCHDRRSPDDEIAEMILVADRRHKFARRIFDQIQTGYERLATEQPSSFQARHKKVISERQYEFANIASDLLMVTARALYLGNRLSAQRLEANQQEYLSRGCRVNQWRGFPPILDCEHIRLKHPTDTRSAPNRPNVLL